MTLAFQPVRIDTGGPDEEGALAFVDERLAAVLVRLSGQHGEQAGEWFIEVGFGPFDGPNHPTFPDLEAAEIWLRRRHAISTDRLDSRNARSDSTGPSG